MKQKEIRNFSLKITSIMNHSLYMNNYMNLVHLVTGRYGPPGATGQRGATGATGVWASFNSASSSPTEKPINCIGPPG